MDGSTNSEHLAVQGKGCAERMLQATEVMFYKPKNLYVIEPQHNRHSVQIILVKLYQILGQ